MVDSLWPRGGWSRAFHYVKHRMRRLPDSPERIARGIFAGVFASFTPFYGFHFFIAAGLAFLLRGNIVAGLMATFFGNPLTFVPIGAMSLNTGYYMLGLNKLSDEEVKRSLGGKFVDAGQDRKELFRLHGEIGGPDFVPVVSVGGIRSEAIGSSELEREVGPDHGG